MLAGEALQAEIGEQAQVDRREIVEEQIVAGAAARHRAAADEGRALPVGGEPGAEAVLEQAGLELDLVPRPAAAASRRRAVEEVELRERPAGSAPHR